MEATTNTPKINLRTITRKTDGLKWNRVRSSTGKNAVTGSHEPMIRVSYRRKDKARNGGYLMFTLTRTFMRQFVDHAHKTGRWAVVTDYAETETSLFLRLTAVDPDYTDARRLDSKTYISFKNNPDLSGPDIEAMIIGAELAPGAEARASRDRDGVWVAEFAKGGRS